MNYGKKSTAKKRTALISRSSMMGKRARVSFIRVLFVSLIALCIAVTCLGVGSFRGVIDTAPDVDDIDIIYESENQAIANCTVSVEDPESKEVSEETVPIYMMYDDEWLIDLSEEFSN